MRDRNGIDRTLVTPIYAQDEPNQAINLGQVAIQFEHEGTSYRKTASAAMKFLPKRDLIFVVPLRGDDSSAGLINVGTKLKLTLPERGVTEDFFCTALGEKHGGLVFSPTRSGITVTQPSSAISTAVFHLFNFPDFWAPERHGQAAAEPATQFERKCRRTVLMGDGWLVTIAALDGIYELDRELDSQGGYVITHIGTIARENGTTFTSERLDDLLTCLHHFLSFTLGCWAGLALPVGFDSDGSRVFEQWGMRNSAGGHWDSFCSWFGRLNGELLSQVFPGFLSLWNNILWREPLARAVYWYVGACTGGFQIGVDTGIILAQTALELLSWTYCVQDRKVVSSEAFKRRNGLNASDRLRLLASTLNIPKEIPDALSGLHARPGRKWDDSMEAITGTRNAVVHPDNQPAVSGDSYFDAYRLSVWLLTLVLLRLCGHNGMYANLLAQHRCSGTVERVPWIASGADMR